MLVRPSGTEALVRVMVEAPTQAGADDAAARIADAVRAIAEPSPTAGLRHAHVARSRLAADAGEGSRPSAGH